MLWHDDFFTTLDGKAKSFWAIGKFGRRPVVLHLYFHFGSLLSPYVWAERHRRRNNSEDRTPIYHQQFEFTTEPESFDFCGFLSKAEKNANLKPDEVLWWETGFWSITLKGISYMGMGLERLEAIVKEMKDGEFALCLSNNVSVILFDSNREERKIVLSVYASNDILPFVEVMEPLRNSIACFSNSRAIKSEMLWEEDIRRFWFAPKDIGIEPVAFIMDKHDPRYKRHPVIRNEFRKTKDPVIGKIEFITGTTSGGFIESDYDGSRRFQLYAEIWELEHASVIEFFFE
jgi:hypothetical protein